MYASGKTVDQIAVKMSMPRQIVTKDLNIAIQEMIEAFAKPSPQQSFVRYAAFQLSVVRKLGDAIKAFKRDKKNKQYNAWVSALRAQSDIYDKVFDKGEEYGVIKAEKADRKALHGGQDIRRELRAEITILSALLDAVDDSTQRQGLKGKAIQASIKYAVRIRKPLETPFGVARAIPDWKYRQRVWNADGNPIPEHRLTEEQKQTVANLDPDSHLHLELAKHEKNKGNSSVHTDTDSTINTQDNTIVEHSSQISLREKGRDAIPIPQDSDDGWLVKPKG
jgi:hypothetical protein